jgi:hypothetical protein
MDVFVLRHKNTKGLSLLPERPPLKNWYSNRLSYRKAHMQQGALQRSLAAGEKFFIVNSKDRGFLFPGSRFPVKTCAEKRGVSRVIGLADHPVYFNRQT